MQYVIGIDIGTTSTKAVAFTDAGEILATCHSGYSAFSDKAGWHELDPIVLFDATTRVLKQAVQEAGKEGLVGVCFSCAMHSLIAVDHTGEPITPAMTWADLRSQKVAQALKGTDAGKRIYRQTGTPVHAMSPLCKLLWMRDNSPEIFHTASRFVSIKEYIWFRLFGTWRIDHSLASATGLFDIYALTWFAESLELAGIGAERLSEPVPCTFSEPALSEALTGGLGLPAGLPLIIGSSDGCLANLGSHAVRHGETTLTIGTSGAVRMTTPAPRYDPQERIFNYILSGKTYVCGGATNNGGNVLQWYAQQFMGRKMPPDPAELSSLIHEAMSVAPGCEGLVFLPYLHGERAPLWDAGATGVFFGIRSNHEQRHFLRAVIEGVSYSLFQVGASLQEAIGPIECVYASGGFIRSEAWLQLIADLFLKKVNITNSADASAIGAAILGMHALGLIPDLEGSQNLIRIQASYLPDPARHTIYQRNYAVFTALYARLKDLMPPP
ncbi:MAG: gluconokinase [Bacteroidota bacterium]|nr:gluconokinase [Bacteroidota bacterium]